MRKGIHLVLVLFVAVSAGCTQQPTDLGLTPEARGSLAGRAMIRVDEPQVEPTRRIQKRVFRPRFNIAAALLATAVSAAVENIASDVDDIPVPDVDLAAMVEERLMADLAVKTDALPSADPLPDRDRAFAPTDEGRAAAVAAARLAGRDGVLLNVRTTEHGIVSTGIRKGADEGFIYRAILHAELVDVTSGEQLARSLCSLQIGIGTLSDIPVIEARIAQEHETALAERAQAEEDLARLRARARHSDAEEIARLLIKLEKPLPPATLAERNVEAIVKGCRTNLGLGLLRPRTG